MKAPRLIPIVITFLSLALIANFDTLISTITAAQEVPQITYVGCATGNEIPPPVNTDYEQAIVELTNQLRDSLGLPPLKRQNDLDRAARYHAIDLAQDDYPDDTRTPNFSPHHSHDRVNGELVQVCTFGDRIIMFYNGRTAGENLAYGYTSPQAAVDGWIGSPGHYDNMTSTGYWEIGTGYAYNRDAYYRNYWSQNFGRRSGVFPVVINLEAATTENSTVDLYIYGSDNWDEMRLRNDGGTWSDWQPFQSELTWKLGSQGGERTVEVEMRRGDNTTSSSDTIFLVSTGEPTTEPTTEPTAEPSPTTAPGPT
ncbi:MAG: CAP domain-containing protein, partial [Chloroflexaceae bacterium]|nr:CAP domain-containing protein [Chloroflexaceae bacterium]